MKSHSEDTLFLYSPRLLIIRLHTRITVDKGACLTIHITNQAEDTEDTGI